MIAFSIEGRARLACRAAFDRGHVLNIDFLTVGQDAIPFHISLRRDEKLVVLNRRDAAGWRREIRFPVAFRRQPVDIEILFTERSAEVIVGGRSLGRFGRWPAYDARGRFRLRRGFPDLAQIAAVRFEGALDETHTITESALRARHAPKGLHLGAALDIRLAGLTRQGALDQAGHLTGLRIEGRDDTIPMVPVELPYLLRGRGRGAQVHEHALSALVPGAIWQDGARAVTAIVTKRDGAEVGRLTITPADIAAALDQAAAERLFETDDLCALQGIEHVRHAGLMSALAPDTTRALTKAAMRFGLVDFLGEGTETGPVAPHSPTPDAGMPDSAVVDTAREAFTARMRANPDQDPQELLSSVAEPLTPVQRHTLALGLVEWFALNADPAALLALIDRERPWSEGSNWEVSVALPLLYAMGLFDDVVAGIELLTQRDEGWVVTPALAWVARAAAQGGADTRGRRPDIAQRSRIASVTCAFAQARNGYFDRAPCVALKGAMVSLIAARHTLDVKARDTIGWTAARVYGLSPDFWRLLDAAALPDPLPDALQRARAVHHVISAMPPRPQDRDAAQEAALQQALARAQLQGMLDEPRFARDLLGSDRAGEIDAAIDAERGNDRLRALAHPMHRPLDDSTADAALLSTALADMRAANAQVDPSPYRQQRERAVALGRAVLEQTQDNPAALEALIQALLPLADLADFEFGLGHGLRLAAALSARGRTDAALTLARALMPPVPLEPERRAAILAAPIMDQARRALDAVGGPVADLARDRLALPAAPPDAPDPDLAADLFDLANPDTDTLFCLYTCQPNLDSRVARIRETWMAQARALGIPVLVFVGDGDGRREGDVVYLDAPDTYEGLPQKTLAMAEWVRRHTRFNALYKIDDDCYVAPDAVMAALTHRKHDYLGRRLLRVRGQMDRTWHMAKARSLRGRTELDKSPEPSVYADGGSGYVLSRRAMEALDRAQRSPQGQRLIALSFMEDKLVGDLLSLQDIQVSTEDYRVSVLRKTRPGGPLVPKWENGFLPFRGGPTALVHLDGDERMHDVHAAARRRDLQPKKIWPSFQPARLGSRSNALDLVSPLETLERVNQAEVAVVACMRNERFMLDAFLAHYRAMGVGGFLIADNGSDDGTIEYLLDQPDVALFAVDTDYSVSQYGVAWQQALMANFRVDRWSLVADADELMFWSLDRRGLLPDLLRSDAFAGADAARVFMLDMYPQGPMAEADFTRGDPFDLAGQVERDPFLAVSAARGPFTDAPTYTSALRHRLIPGSRAELFVAQKYALLRYRPWMRLSAGLHYVTDITPAKRDLIFAHFKYNAAFHAKAQAEVARKQHFNNAEEYRRYLALAAEGRDVIADPAVSVPWQDCEVVRRICAGERLTF